MRDMVVPREARTVRKGNERPDARGLVLTAALLGFFMISLDATAVNVALPAIGRSLRGATAGLQWVVDGYTVPFAALLISAGSVSDRLGARRVFGWGLAAFALASAGCGLAPGLSALIAARVVQGGAAAIMLPSSLALVRHAFTDPAARARAVAGWSSGGAAAIAAGPVIGGILTSTAGWRAIFYVNLPVGAAALTVLALRAPRSARLAVPFDPAGQTAAVLALAALTWGTITGGDGGFGRPPVLGAFAVAVAAAGCFLAVEARTARPAVPLGVFRAPAVAACLAAGFAINVAFYGLAFVLSLYFQQVLGASPVSAGLLFLPMTGLLTAANLVSARVAARWGHHVPVRAGLSTGTLGMALLALLAACWPERTAVEIALVPAGAGLGFALPSLTFLLLDSLPASSAGLAGGLFNAVRQTGGAVAVAAFGALVSGSFLTGMRESMALAAALLAASTLAACTVFRHASPAGPPSVTPDPAPAETARREPD
jgi:DHA2 family methylenomycin A resistance protein-like MFS transporter